MTLDEIGLRYLGGAAVFSRDKYLGGDKTSTGKSFTSFYESLLAPKRHLAGVVFLEVGVWYGKSLAMWADYFTSGDAQIHGVDINLRRWREHKPELESLGAFSRNTVYTYEVDTYSDKFAEMVAHELPQPDVVLDDGNHNAHSQWHLFALLFPRLRSGGIYIIEDIEQPSAVFTMGGGDSSDRGSGVFFAVVIAQTASEAFLRSPLVQREAERCVEAAVERHARARESLGKRLAALREKQRSLGSSPRGKAGGSPQKGEKRIFEQLEAAIRQKLSEIDSMPVILSKQERLRVRSDFMTAVEAAASLAKSVATVQVRNNNVVFHKK